MQQAVRSLFIAVKSTAYWNMCYFPRVYMRIDVVKIHSLKYNLKICHTSSTMTSLFFFSWTLQIYIEQEFAIPVMVLFTAKHFDDLWDNLKTQFSKFGVISGGKNNKCGRSLMTVDGKKQSDGLHDACQLKACENVCSTGPTFWKWVHSRNTYHWFHMKFKSLKL